MEPLLIGIDNATTYLFLVLVLIMGVVNTDLLCQIRKRRGNSTSTFRSEKTMLWTVLLFFELGYLERFFNDCFEK